jgi:hypothetical protein
MTTRDELRTRLLALAKELNDLVAKELPPPRRRRDATPVTKGMVSAIRRLRREYPGLTQDCIAAMLNINQGRVSEALRGLEFNTYAP